MTRAKNPSPTLPTWRLSAPLPESPVAEADADAPVAELPSAMGISFLRNMFQLFQHLPVADPVVLEPPKVAVAEALLPVWLPVGAVVAEAVKK